MSRAALGLLLGFALASSACTHGHAIDVTDANPLDPDAGPVEQSPPQEPAALLAWLVQGYYEDWHCEPEAHPARPPGAHGSDRICSNDVLAGAGPDGDFPIGAASVKELIRDGRVDGWAVAVKAAAESGDDGAGWYWYERSDGEVYGEGRGFTGCTGCHAGAGPSFAPTARDFVFTQVAP
jgi:hypothetical protein